MYILNMHTSVQCLEHFNRTNGLTLLRSWLRGAMERDTAEEIVSILLFLKLLVFDEVLAGGVLKKAKLGNSCVFDRVSTSCVPYCRGTAEEVPVTPG